MAAPHGEYVPTSNGNGHRPNPAETEPGGGTLLDYVRVLRRHLRLVLAIAAVVTGLATYKAYTDPPVYRAGAVIRLRNTRQAMAGGLGDASSPLGGGFMGGTADPYISQIQVLRSRSVTGMVVDQEGLRLQPETGFFPVRVMEQVQVDPEVQVDSVRMNFREDGYELIVPGARRLAAYGAPAEVPGIRLIVTERPQEFETMRFNLVPREQAAASLVDNLVTEKRQSTDVIDVRYETTDPVRAQRVVNSLVEAFQSFNAGREQQVARRRRIFIEGQIAYTDSVLRSAQERLAGFRTQEHVYSKQEQFANEQLELMQIDRERSQLQTDLSMYRSLLAQLRRADDAGRSERVRALASVPSVSANPVIAGLITQLNQYQIARDTMTNGQWRSAASNPDLQRIEALITSAESKLASAVESQGASLEARLQALNELEGRRRARIQGLPETESQEVRLLAEVEYVSEMARQLRAEYQRAQIAEAAEAGQVEIVDAALPGVPTQSTRVRTILFGLALGLMLGGGTGFLLESLNTSIRRKDEIESVLHIPELAVIPSIDGVTKTKLVNRLLPLGKKNGKPAKGERKKGNELVAANNTHTPVAEAYRTLRTNLLFSQTGEELRTLLVTSSAPSEGKSTTAANLAVTFAQSGKRVVLVDCDLRKARLHRVFGVPREPGFTHFILGHKPLEEVVRSTPVENLTFISAGTLPPNPSELVGSPRMRAALQALAEEFDVVLLDTPPLLAASDAAILGRFTDGVVLVVRAGSTERQAAQQSVQKLNALGSHILGGVLNDPDSKVGKYGGYYQYEYYGSEA